MDILISRPRCDPKGSVLLSPIHKSRSPESLSALFKVTQLVSGGARIWAFITPVSEPVFPRVLYCGISPSHSLLWPKQQWNSLTPSYKCLQNRSDTKDTDLWWPPPPRSRKNSSILIPTAALGRMALCVLSASKARHPSQRCTGTGGQEWLSSFYYCYWSPYAQKPCIFSQAVSSLMNPGDSAYWMDLKITLVTNSSTSAYKELLL